ncbi:MAG: sugar transferase, partial [Myxococcales bacterium]|nr:sugar transferase [Myxococcales bacterium]
MAPLPAALAIGALALAFIAPFALYPLLLWAWPVRRRATPTEPGAAPRISVLIPACNEGAHLAAKLDQTLALPAPRPLEVLVYSDGSTDDTVAIARRYAERGVRLIVGEVRKGKAHGLNTLAKAATGELLLLTDTSAVLTPDTVPALAAPFADPEVGAVAAAYTIRGEGGTEGEYWALESRIRAAEAERGLLVSAAGAAYMVRARDWTPLPPDTVNDDYVIPLRLRLAGRRVAFAPGASASDDPTARLEHAFHRWVRIAFGNYQMLWRHRAGFLRPTVAPALLRKLLRTMGPLLLLAALAVLTAALWPWAAGRAVAGACWLLALGVPLLSRDARPTAGPRLWRFLRLFLVAQYAYLVGLARFTLRRRRRLWRRPNESAVAGQLAPLPTSVRVTKRLVDLAACAVAFTLGAPVFLAVALAVRLDSPGPVIYRQRRMRPGDDGVPTEFEMLKFRSMVVDAEARSGPAFAQQADPRITRVGAFLRKHRLDELPQFINVLRGEMSLIGPRPERQTFASALEMKVPGFTDRHMVVKPGLTGW